MWTHALLSSLFQNIYLFYSNQKPEFVSGWDSILSHLSLRMDISLLSLHLLPCCCYIPPYKLLYDSPPLSPLSFQKEIYITSPRNSELSYNRLKIKLHNKSVITFPSLLLSHGMVEQTHPFLEGQYLTSTRYSKFHRNPHRTVQSTPWEWSRSLDDHEGHTPPQALHPTGLCSGGTVSLNAREWIIAFDGSGCDGSNVGRELGRVNGGDVTTCRNRTCNRNGEAQNTNENMYEK